MNLSFSFLKPDEQVIFFSRGITLREIFISPLIILFLPFLVNFTLSKFFYLLTRTTFIIVGSVFLLMYLFVVINFTLRVIFAKNILTDQRVILIAYRLSWNRVEIPLEDIEKIFIDSLGFTICRRSKKSLKGLPIAKAKDFVDTYQKFINNH